jgi:hypothetical protein
MKPDFCCGWNGWCIADSIQHWIARLVGKEHLPGFDYLCDKHTAHMMRYIREALR